jgi:hypothetical protein
MKYLILLLEIIVLSSCVKPPESPAPKPMPISEQGAYILNEGNFQWGNASVDFIDFNSGQISKDVFKTTNNRILGDVLQSAVIINSNIWMVVNNSGSIEVVNSRDCKSIHKITNLISPRYALPISGGRVLVSDLYANGIHVISSASFVKTGFIPLPGWTEKMLLDTNAVWVTNVKRSFVYLFHPMTLSLMDSIEAGMGNQDIVMNKTGNIWILASGDESTNIPGRITCIAGGQKEILRRYDLPESGGKSLCLSADQKTLYYLYNNAVWTISENMTELSATPLISAPSGTIFYGLSVHPVSGNLFVTDAKDYVSKGRIIEFTPDGNYKQEYSAGIIPNGLLFIHS